jgi:hypothetical protein
MDSIQIPYHVPPEELPSELPIEDAIESSKEVLCEQSARKVVGVGSHFVVKYGLQAALATTNRVSKKALPIDPYG